MTKNPKKPTAGIPWSDWVFWSGKKAPLPFVDKNEDYPPRYLIEVAEGQGVGRVMEHYQMLDIEESTFAFYVESAGDQER